VLRPPLLFCEETLRAAADPPRPAARKQPTGERTPVSGLDGRAVKQEGLFEDGKDGVGWADELAAS